MFDTHSQHCDFCQSGQVTRRDQHIAFRQWTDRGYVSCRVTVPLGVCDRCQSSHWNKEAEVIVEEAVRREYEKRGLEQIPPGLNRGDSQSSLAEGVCRH
jgi:hypothetical protein